uniref:C2H2-type domain-containing protein n=1 Tax=Strongyloides venezuelensis TaxID=75913 RepID=A0A0K0F8Z5_STRVS
MPFSSLALRDSVCEDDVYSKVVNLPVACFPDFSKQVRSLVQEYYNGECKLEANLLFKGSGSISKGNLSLGYLSSGSKNLSEDNSSSDLRTDDISDAYSCLNCKIKTKKVKDYISTASEGKGIIKKSENIKDTRSISEHGHIPEVKHRQMNDKKLHLYEKLNDTSSDTVCKTSPKVFNKLRIYAHPNFMNSTREEKISSETTSKSCGSKYLSSNNKSPLPVFDDIKLVFYQNTGIHSLNSRKSLTPISFDTHGSPRRRS